MDPRSNGCVSWYFIGKQFFQLANSWCEVLHRSSRSFLRVGCVEIGVCRIVWFRSGWSHSARRGRTTKFLFTRTGKWESRWSRFKVRVRFTIKRRLVAEFLTVISFLERFSTGEKSKWRHKAKSFCSWRTVSFNVCLSRCSSFKCWLNCLMVLWIACKQLDWCWRDEGKRAEDPGVSWWTAASGLDWFVGWRRGRRNVPSVMCGLTEGAWERMVCGGIPQINWAKSRLIVVELHSEIGGSEEDW